MRIAIVGSGGLGGYYGALLQGTGQDVTFLARGAHLAAMRERGLRVESVIAAPITLRVRATKRPDEVGSVDLVLFAVKSYDTKTAAALLPPLLEEETAVLTLQNGVDNVDLLAEAVGRGHVLGGLCYIYSEVASPGVIKYTGGPRLVAFGELDGRITGRAMDTLQALRATGAPVELSGHILVDMWEKYLFITAHGGMTALTRLPIGTIRETPETYEVYLTAAEEAAAVGRAHGISIPPGQRDRVKHLADSLEANVYSSLYSDLVARRRLELEALLGNVVRLGVRYSVPTPVCSVIYAALRPFDVLARSKTMEKASA